MNKSLSNILLQNRQSTNNNLSIEELKDLAQPFLEYISTNEGGELKESRELLINSIIESSDLDTTNNKNLNTN